MIQFDEFEGFDPKAGPHCIACEAMLTDAVDGTLGEIDRAWFDRHIGTCVRCAEKLSEAQRGSAWLELLKSPRPEPGAELMSRILAQTSLAGRAEDGAQNPLIPAAAAFTELPYLVPAPAFSDRVLAFPPAYAARSTGMRAFGRILLEPRLAMTAAMAFFSIALTMNLSGVRLDQLHANDLKPSNLKRSYFLASSRAVQYYDNLRVVHVMESRVDDLKQATEDAGQRYERPAGTPAPESKPAPKQDDRPGGTSRRETPMNAPDKPQALLVRVSADVRRTSAAAPVYGAGGRA